MAFTTSLLRSEGPLTLTATLSRRLPYAVVAHWQTANGTALAGTDFVGNSGQIVIDAGELSASVEVTLIDYEEAAAAEFEVEIYSVTGARLNSDATAEVTLEASVASFLREFSDDTLQTFAVGVPAGVDRALTDYPTSAYEVVATPDDADGWNPSTVDITRCVRVSPGTGTYYIGLLYTLPAEYQLNCNSASFRAAFLHRAESPESDYSWGAFPSSGLGSLTTTYQPYYQTLYTYVRDTSGAGGNGTESISKANFPSQYWWSTRMQWDYSTLTMTLWAKRMSTGTVLGPYTRSGSGTMITAGKLRSINKGTLGDGLYKAWHAAAWMAFGTSTDWPW